ncbi:hypothetical protein CBR_g24057 [Chara braunii]|uniref:Uncharacterized protein n=1 Tax=Chara braunii TaxID=69332 RepID=A0A388L5M7_CHABU|nr:hypothetical protein CBR_g24057 [Chara braunii]|eukprot:GBG77611.1 hypothetical protein CBR_g24057 [Chara braunii]
MVNLLGPVGCGIAPTDRGADHGGQNSEDSNKSAKNNKRSTSNDSAPAAAAADAADGDGDENDKKIVGCGSEQSRSKEEKTIELSPSPPAPPPPPPPHAAAVFLRFARQRCLLRCLGFLILLCVCALACFVVYLSAVIVHPRLQLYHRHHRQPLPMTDCRVLSRDVGLRRVRLCTGGTPSIRRRVLERVVGKSYVRVKQPCYFHYYWTCVFQLEFIPKRSCMPVRVEVDAPGSLLPLHCRPDFYDAWNTKEKYRVNNTYPCTYNPHDLRQVDIALKESFQTCKLELEDDGNGVVDEDGNGEGTFARFREEVGDILRTMWTPVVSVLHHWTDRHFWQFQDDLLDGGGVAAVAATFLMSAGYHFGKAIMQCFIFSLIRMAWIMVSHIFCRLLHSLFRCATSMLPPLTRRSVSQGGMSSSVEAFSDAGIGVAEKNSIRSSSNIKIVSRLIFTNDSSEPPGSTNSSFSSSSSPSSPSSFSSSCFPGNHQTNDLDKHQRRPLIISTRGAAEGAATSI